MYANAVCAKLRQKFCVTNFPMANFLVVKILDTIDDTFAVFESEDKCKNFFLYSSLHFMFKKELNSSLSSLDILVESTALSL